MYSTEYITVEHYAMFATGIFFNLRELKTPWAYRYNDSIRWRTNKAPIKLLSRSSQTNQRRKPKKSIMSGPMGTYLADMLESHASASIDLVSDNARVTHSDSRRIVLGPMGTYLGDMLKSHASASIDLVSDNARATRSDSYRIFFGHSTSSSGLRQSLLDSAVSSADNRQALFVSPRRNSYPQDSMMISGSPRREPLTPQTYNSELSLTSDCFFCPGSSELFRGKRRQVSKNNSIHLLCLSPPN
jgi:hypothetical protein